MKSNIKGLLIAALIVLMNQAILAQGPGRKRERMEEYRAMRIAYFTENLDLSPTEAEKFWPLYNQHEKNKSALMKERRETSRDVKENFELLTEEEARELNDAHIQMRMKDVEMDIAFQKELEKILPAKKIVKFYITEVEFREHMLRRIRGERHKEQRQQGRQ